MLICSNLNFEYVGAGPVMKAQIILPGDTSRAPDQNLHPQEVRVHPERFIGRLRLHPPPVRAPKGEDHSLQGV